MSLKGDHSLVQMVWPTDCRWWTPCCTTHQNQCSPSKSTSIRTCRRELERGGRRHCRGYSTGRRQVTHHGIQWFSMVETFRQTHCWCSSFSTKSTRSCPRASLLGWRLSWPTQDGIMPGQHCRRQTQWKYIICLRKNMQCRKWMSLPVSASMNRLLKAWQGTLSCSVRQQRMPTSIRRKPYRRTCRHGNEVVTRRGDKSRQTWHSMPTTNGRTGNTWLLQLWPRPVARRLCHQHPSLCTCHFRRRLSPWWCPPCQCCQCLLAFTNQKQLPWGPCHPAKALGPPAHLVPHPVPQKWLIS